MRAKHRRLFLMYLSVGLLNIVLLLMMPLFQNESSTWMLVMFPLLTIIWFANAFVHWRHMKQETIQ